jgi:ribosome-associated protein
MDIRKLQRAIVDGLENVKAQDIVVFNTEHLSPLFERVIIATGSSNRQTKALASGVREAVREAGFTLMRTEGADNGEWIIVDCAAAVVHIMQPAIRQYYQLEEIWGGKPVSVKLKSEKTGLVKASEPMDKGAAKKPAAKKAPAKKAATQTAGTVAGRVALKKAAAKKASLAATKPVAQKGAAKKVAVKKVAAKKSATTVTKMLVNEPKKSAKPSPARKAAAKPAPKQAPKPVVRKVAAKKVAVKKVAAKRAR